MVLYLRGGSLFSMETTERLQEFIQSAFCPRIAVCGPEKAV
jgi:hypothetical protein